MALAAAGEHEGDEGEACKIHRRADRKVNAADRDGEGHGNGDDGEQGEIVDQHAEEVRAGEETRRERREQGEDRGERSDKRITRQPLGEGGEDGGRHVRRSPCGRAAW